MLRNILTLVAVMALALFMVPTTLADDSTTSDNVEPILLAAVTLAHAPLYDPAIHDQEFRGGASMTHDQYVSHVLPKRFGISPEEFYAKNPDWVSVKNHPMPGMRVGLGGFL